MKDYHLVSFSGGKDSTAMLLMMKEKGMPIDEVIFCDTGVEFLELYKHVERVESDLGIKITRLKGEHTFEYMLYEYEPKRIRTAKNSGLIRKFGEAGKRGYGFPSVMSRWCTKALKIIPTSRHVRKLTLEGYNVIQYTGIAADEVRRLNNKNNQGARHPLAEWGMTEKDCLDYCYKKGYDFGGLYTHFNRLGCWCCPLQSMADLTALYQYYPELWQKLRDMQSKTFGGRGDFHLGHSVGVNCTVYDLEKKIIERLKGEK